MPPPQDPPCDGELSEIRPDQLYQILQPGAGGGKALAMWNCTSDTQFKVQIEFQNPDLEVLDAKEVGENRYSINLYPNECKFLVRGTWRATRKKMSYGPPDKSWRDEQESKVRSILDKEIKAVEALKTKLGAKAKDDEALAQACIDNGIPFIDNSFPPQQSSVVREGEGKMAIYPWMRPAVYCAQEKAPLLFEGEIEPNDIDQGLLGDCYFMCALACLSEFPDLIRAAYSAPQCPELGIYRCTLCKDGWWNTHTVDDTLPISLTTGFPAFAKNREEPNELWVSILEKTYAKLHGSYAAIKTGDPAMALADMLGAPYDRFNKRPEWENPDAMFDYLQECDEADHLMCVNTPGVDTSAYSSANKGADGSALDLAAKYKEAGLCTGHAFSLIRVKKTSKGHRLCMIRNPWGNEMEWNGDWSDESPLWTKELQEEVGFYKGDDGTFWMAWEDVLKWFDSGSITYRVGPLKGWSQLRVRCAFEKGIPNTIMRVRVNKPTKSWFGCHQVDQRTLPPKQQKKYLGILLTVMRQAGDCGQMCQKMAANSKSFMIGRDAFAEATLQPKETYYILIQSYHDEDREFVASAFFENCKNVESVSFMELDEDQKVRYNPPTKFNPSHCESYKQVPMYQKLTPEIPEPSMVENATSVEWDKPAGVAIPDTKPPPMMKRKPCIPKLTKVADDDAPLRSPTLSPRSSPLPEDNNSFTNSFSNFMLPSKVEQPNAANAQLKGRAKHTDPSVEVYSGYLEKFSTGRNSGGFSFKSLMPDLVTKNWKKRYFRLKRGGELSYYETEQSTEPLGVVELKNFLSVRTVLVSKATQEHSSNADGPNDFLIKFEDDSDGSKWSLLLRAPDNRTREAWVSKDAIGGIVCNAA